MWVIYYVLGQIDSVWVVIPLALFHTLLKIPINMMAEGSTKHFFLRKVFSALVACVGCDIVVGLGLEKKNRTKKTMRVVELEDEPNWQ